MKKLKIQVCWDTTLAGETLALGNWLGRATPGTKIEDRGRSESQASARLWAAWGPVLYPEQAQGTCGGQTVPRCGMAVRPALGSGVKSAEG